MEPFPDGRAALYAADRQRGEEVLAELLQEGVLAGTDGIDPEALGRLLRLRAQPGRHRP